MTKFGKIALLLLALGMLAVALISLTSYPAVAGPASAPVTVVNTSASPVPVQTVAASLVTHMGQKTSSHLTLRSFSSGTFHRILPDGTEDSTFTSIPTGEALVVTDVEWLCTGGSPGFMSFLNIIEPPSGLIFKSQATTSNDFNAGASEHLTSGFVVAGQLPHASQEACAILDHVFLHGYLVPQS
jgi:hypothetical protein